MFNRYVCFVLQYQIIYMTKLTEKCFNVLLTVPLSTTLVNDQLDAQLLYPTISPLQPSTYFEQRRIHHQEVSCINTASGIVTLC